MPFFNRIYKMPSLPSVEFQSPQREMPFFNRHETGNCSEVVRFNPLSGTPRCLTKLEAKIYKAQKVFQSPQREMPFFNATNQAFLGDLANVSIPSAGNAFLQQSQQRDILGPSRCFNPLSGKCLSSTLCHPGQLAPFYCFNPLSGKCLSSTRVSRRCIMPTFKFQSPQREMPFFNCRPRTKHYLLRWSFNPLSGAPRCLTNGCREATVRVLWVQPPRRTPCYFTDIYANVHFERD